MLPLQTFIDATMAIVVLGIVLTLVIIFGFIWAYEKIAEPPEELEENEKNAHGV